MIRTQTFSSVLRKDTRFAVRSTYAYNSDLIAAESDLMTGENQVPGVGVWKAWDKDPTLKGGRWKSTDSKDLAKAGRVKVKSEVPSDYFKPN